MLIRPIHSHSVTKVKCIPYKNVPHTYKNDDGKNCENVNNKMEVKTNK